jgi:hypothetical protein
MIESATTASTGGAGTTIQPSEAAARLSECATVKAVTAPISLRTHGQALHERLVGEHSFALGYTWTKRVLQDAGLVRRGRRRSAHRKKRPRRPLPGMLLFQDGSSHVWLEGQAPLDLIVTLDDATSEIYSAFLVVEEGTQSSLRGLAEVIGRYGLFSSLYSDRGRHYFVTPKAGGKVAKGQLTQVGRALAQLGIEHIPAYSPEARGRMERVFGTLQGRLPQELRLAGITTIAAANGFLAERFVAAHNARFAVATAKPGSAFVPFAGDLTEILCVQAERVVGNDNCVRYGGLEPADPGAAPPPPLRQGQGAGARLRRRPPCGVPRPALPGALRVLRAADRGSRTLLSRRLTSARRRVPGTCWTTQPRCPHPHSGHWPIPPMPRAWRSPPGAWFREVHVKSLTSGRLREEALATPAATPHRCIGSGRKVPP